MDNMKSRRVSLSDNQKRKLRVAYRRRKPTVVGLSYKQLTGGGGGGDVVLLTNDQYRLTSKAIEKRKGVRLVLDYNQLVQNKNGGLLKEILDFVEETVPGGKSIISPLVRRQLGPLLKNKFLPWVKQLLDDELDTIIQKDPKGSGLKKAINDQIDRLIVEASKKKVLRPRIS